MKNEDTYYGEDEREAMKDMYNPTRHKEQISEGCVNKVLSGRHVLVVGTTGSGIK